MCCTLEVLAPTLAKSPIYVRTAQDSYRCTLPSNGLNLPNTQNDEPPWSNDLDGPEDKIEVYAKKFKRTNENTKRIDAVLRSVQSYIRRPVQAENIGHSTQPIRLSRGTVAKSQQPRLEIDIIVIGRKSIEQECSNLDMMDGAKNGTAELGRFDANENATIKLVRMVNAIPMMESAESAGIVMLRYIPNSAISYAQNVFLFRYSACGFVQGVSSNAVWAPFGLAVSRSNDPVEHHSWLPEFELRDSEQVSNFLQHQLHSLRQSHQEKLASQKCNHGVAKRKRTVNHGQLPAKFRLGEVLVIVNIFSEPSSLPLPTLSKVCSRFYDSLSLAVALSCPQHVGFALLLLY